MRRARRTLGAGVEFGFRRGQGMRVWRRQGVWTAGGRARRGRARGVAAAGVAGGRCGRRAPSAATPLPKRLENPQCPSRGGRWGGIGGAVRPGSAARRLGGPAGRGRRRRAPPALLRPPNRERRRHQRRTHMMGRFRRRRRGLGVKVEPGVVRWAEARPTPGSPAWPGLAWPGPGRPCPPPPQHGTGVQHLWRQRSHRRAGLGRAEGRCTAAATPSTPPNAPTPTPTAPPHHHPALPHQPHTSSPTSTAPPSPPPCTVPSTAPTPPPRPPPPPPPLHPQQQHPDPSGVTVSRSRRRV